MKETLKSGVRLQRSIEVDASRTIDFMGEGLRVYGTPYMIKDIEHTCRDLLLEHAEEGEDSVGVRVEVDHMGATLLGQAVKVRATVVEIEGPRVTFDVEVHDAVEQVGGGRHSRFIIKIGKLKQRLEAKAAKVRASG